MNKSIISALVLAAIAAAVAWYALSKNKQETGTDPTQTAAEDNAGSTTTPTIKDLVYYSLTMNGSREVVKEYGANARIELKVGNPNSQGISADIEIINDAGKPSIIAPVQIPANKVLTFTYPVTIDFEGYRRYSVAGLVLVVKGEKIYNAGQVPAGSYHCPYCSFKGNSDKEIGYHAATTHFGYKPQGGQNDCYIGELGTKLAVYDYVSPNADLKAKCRTALDNVISGDDLMINLSQAEKWKVYDILYRAGFGEDAHKIVFNYVYWDKWRRVDQVKALTPASEA